MSSEEPPGPNCNETEVVVEVGVVIEIAVIAVVVVEVRANERCMIISRICRLRWRGEVQSYLDVFDELGNVMMQLAQLLQTDICTHTTAAS
jgi:hypothetical protein